MAKDVCPRPRFPYTPRAMRMRGVQSRLQSEGPTRTIFAAIIILVAITGGGFNPKSFVRRVFADDLDRDARYIAPFVPTPWEVVERMLEIAEIRSGDVLYDLGSGDGRIVITAAKKYGIRSVGIEINPDLVKESREMVKAAGLEQLVEIREEHLLTADFSAATVVTLYLYPGANLRLRSALQRQLKPGSRIVSHQFAMGNWRPDLVDEMKDSAGLVRTIYLWRIRARSRG